MIIRIDLASTRKVATRIKFIDSYNNMQYPNMKLHVIPAIVRRFKGLDKLSILYILTLH
jgi:hypothetical protein